MSTPRFLIVDDDADSIFLARRNLTASFPDAVIDQALTGEDALLKLRQGAQYEAIVTDYRMPVMDGLTMVRAIRGMGRGMPIVLRTAMQDIQNAAIAAGVDYVLPWYRWRDLGETMKELLTCRQESGKSKSA